MKNQIIGKLIEQEKYKYADKKLIAEVVKDTLEMSGTPELLEACKEMIEALKFIKQGAGHSPVKYAQAKMHEAIAKAEGR